MHPNVTERTLPSTYKQKKTPRNPALGSPKAIELPAVMRTKAQPRPAGSSRTFRLAAAAIAAIAVYVLILHTPITNSSLHHEASAAMGPVTAAAAEAAAEEAWAASAVRAASASVDLAAISAASASADAAAAATAIAQQEVDAALAASADSGAAAAAEATAAAASRPGTAAWLGAQELLDYCNAHPGAASDVAEAGAECVASRSDCMAQRLPGQVLFEQYVRQTATRIGRATVGVLRSDLHKPGNQRVEEVLRLAGLSDGSSAAFEVAAPVWDVTFKNITLTSVGNDFDVRASRLLRLPGVLCRVSR